jgi:membrane-bound serine protease (ClpP class)
MTLLIILFVAGILLILAEVILPGGIVGAIGALMMLAGCAIAFSNYGPGGGMLAVFGSLALAGAALYWEFRYLPNTRLGRKAFLTKEITAVSAAVGGEARELVGQTAEALTMLSPSGYVSVGGRRYEAFCRSGQAPAGSILEIVGADNFRLIVNRRLPTT